jgi:leucyl aminopeptidase (aminopeptidase T)
MPRGRARAEETVARAVLGGYLRARRGESVTIESWSHALGWARAFVVEARRRGSSPTLVVEDEEAFFHSLALPRTRALPIADSGLAGLGRVYVYLPGPDAFPRLMGLPDPEFEAVVTRHGRDWWRAVRRARIRGVHLAVASVTATAAARYRVDREAWLNEVVRASIVPPRRLARTARKVVEHLRGAREIRVRHPNGTDLTARLLSRPPVVEDGRPPHDGRRRDFYWTPIPTGLVGVALSEDRTEGVWESNRPVYDRFGDPPVAEGARFTFVRGRLKEFSFDRGGRAFASAYAHAGRGRNLAGAFTFGLNPEVERAPEIGELAHGSAGLVLGDGRLFGGRRHSRFSYLTVLQGADIDVDGRPAWRRGHPIDGARR